MKTFQKFWLRALMAVLAIGCASAVMAQDGDDEPVITIKTSSYDTNGESNVVSILIGGIEEGGYIDVDFGYGKEEHELEVAQLDEEGSWSGTFVSCNVSKDGMIRIYADDPSNIDVLYASGCYIRSIEMPKLNNLRILDLSHNELESLDLTSFTELSALYLNDNTFNKSPLVIGSKPNLLILDIGQIDNMTSEFTLTDYPSLVTFDAWSNKALTSLDPTQCLDLQKISIDATSVASLDLSNNEKLTILNISDTRIAEIDLSHNPYLNQLFCDHLSGTVNSDVKMNSLDLKNSPNLVYLFASGNNFTSIDVSNNVYLQDIYLNNNLLTEINLENNVNLNNVMLRNNYFNFATLPLPNESWNQYDYMQRNMPIERSHKEGTVLDFSEKVLREGYTTTMAMYMTSESDPNYKVELDESYYTFDAGKVTLLKETTDSVYVAFACDAFPESALTSMPLRTDKFIVKSEANFGKDDVALSFVAPISSDGVEITMSIGILGATEANPKKFYVDFGDGEKQEFTATTSSELPSGPNVNCVNSALGKVTVYVPEGEMVGSFGISGITLNSIDLSNLRAAKTLMIENAGLYSIDLGWCRSLSKLILRGNHFNTLNIRGANDGYQKTLLTNIDLSNNELTAVTLNDTYTIHHLDLSKNKLTELNMKDADMMEWLSLKGNELTTINLSYCTLMTDLDLSDNNISSIVLPSEYSFKRVHVEGNALTFATLPTFDGVETYTFAPQDDVVIPVIGPGCDLAAHNFGGNTVYVVKFEDGDEAVKDTDYTIEDGKIRFLEPIIGKKVYVEMTNSAFDGLTMKTTLIEAAAMPTHVFGTFTTPSNSTGTLIMIAKDPSTLVCIDWKGDGVELEQYIVGTSATTFDVTSYAGCTARVYSYNENSGITVFSISNVLMSSADFSQMTELTALTVRGAGLSSITMPNAALEEINLDNNNFSSIDLTAFSSSLKYLTLNSNQFTEFDASLYPRLFLLGMNANQLTSVNLNNKNMWQLALSTNQLTSIDLSGVPAMEQISLDHNQLETLDVSMLDELRVLLIDNNKFRFSTLPVDMGYALYTYKDQAALPVNLVEGKVDFSSEAVIEGVETVYRWFVDTPYFDDNDELTGEELYVDDEYSVENGVTSFYSMIDNVVGVLANDAFPNLLLYTEAFDITTTGINAVSADATAISVVDGNKIVATNCDGSEMLVYGTNGALIRKVAAVNGVAVASDMLPGIYVVTVGDCTTKVAVK
ncbi:MAG: hypothetical protein ACI4AH_00965 [Muribaculaceae bacterium]